ncbi:AAA15 family ATPase/GTPase [Spirosoma lacussanchae]|uniref:AAA family ATPase n=1 Tax=Spirosoma lacussanchae TaxID=1884249 RepID=UPI001109C34D|nr:AAA family ATPase [Spirosoma lacussanchae]
MLRSLDIRNYRNLRHLTIGKLGRVNLLVGKNNTGKTSVLEAIYIWANYGRFQTIYEILETRDGTFESTSEEPQLRAQALLASLFTNRVSRTKEDSAQITTERNGSKSQLTLSLRLMEPAPSEVEITPTKKLLFFEVDSDADHNIIQPYHILDAKTRSDFSFLQPRDIKNQFIRSNEINAVNVGHLYDEIATTDWEEEVVYALRIIDSRVSKLNFRTDIISNKRYPIVRLEDSNQQLPLRSMGDGINRILTIILAMVNCENGYLFIDEFENGLHYSVQEKLWEVIFHLTERLNIQVFATTHSSDTIRAFTSILAQKGSSEEAGKVIRLQLHEGEVRAVDYSPEELGTAVEFNIEVR